MTKARARERAKKRAAKTGVKHEANPDRSGPKVKPGQFDPGVRSMKGANVNAGNSGGVKRGAARSG